MTVKDIIIERLTALGADGLNNDQCGCPLNDLMRCDGAGLDCVPAKYRTVTQEDKDTGKVGFGFEIGDDFFEAID